MPSEERSRDDTSVIGSGSASRKVGAPSPRSACERHHHPSVTGVTRGGRRHVPLGGKDPRTKRRLHGRWYSHGSPGCGTGLAQDKRQRPARGARRRNARPSGHRGSENGEEDQCPCRSDARGLAWTDRIGVRQLRPTRRLHRRHRRLRGLPPRAHVVRRGGLDRQLRRASRERAAGVVRPNHERVLLRVPRQPGTGRIDQRAGRHLRLGPLGGLRSGRRRQQRRRDRRVRHRVDVQRAAERRRIRFGRSRAEHLVTRHGPGRRDGSGVGRRLGTGSRRDEPHVHRLPRSARQRELPAAEAHDQRRHRGQLRSRRRDPGRVGHLS